jgi:hypothetical protein
MWVAFRVPWPIVFLAIGIVVIAVLIVVKRRSS